MKSKAPPRPFLKWAGGKSRMLPHIAPLVPAGVNRYFEPFVGGGALFFDLAGHGGFRRAVLGDMNHDLMNAYAVVRGSVEPLIQELKSDRYSYAKERYLEIRAEDPDKLDDVKRAARFLYLNRTCFNGLYRVNRSGTFNVPFGRYKDPVICDSEALRSASSALKKARLVERDFGYVAREAKPGDFVYFDPPYYPLSETSKFTSYTSGGFGLEEHTRLALIFAELAAKGVAVILSNSYCPTTVALYRDFETVKLQGSRNVGGPAEYRKPVHEMMVVANVRASHVQAEPAVL